MTKFVIECKLLFHHLVNILWRFRAVHKVVLVHSVRIYQIDHNRVVQNVVTIVALWANASYIMLK